ncbi:MAG TPA: thiolase family protein [Vicinamibacterales bacterium]|nr:thiolase family protein [Vicinamibacterales bacterium]
MSQDSSVAIIGIGLHPFGRHEASAAEQGAFAVRQALADASLSWSDVQFAAGGSLDGGNADALVNHLGLSGIPFVNVRNGCATGGSALAMARSAIASGEADIAVAVGFDKHPRGAFSLRPEEWGLPTWYGATGLMLTTQFFALRIQRYLHDHAMDPSVLGAVAARGYRNGAGNPSAWRRKAMTEQEIVQSPSLNPPLTQYMFCSPSEGAAAVVLASAKKVRELGAKPVWIKAVSLATRRPGTFEVFTTRLPASLSPSAVVMASSAAYEKAGVGPQDIEVAQVLDTDAGSELIQLAENGFCKHGEQEAFIRSGATEISGRLPINTDGGCMANGEPIGASGLRQVHEVCLQLRGEAGQRQISGKHRLGYTQVYGAPGVSAVTILQV